MSLQGRPDRVTVAALPGLAIPSRSRSRPGHRVGLPQGCYQDPDGSAGAAAAGHAEVPHLHRHAAGIRDGGSFDDEAYIRIKKTEVWGPSGINPLQSSIRTCPVT